MGEFAEILAPSRKGFNIVDQSKSNSPTDIDFSAGTRGAAAYREGFLLGVKRKINNRIFSA